MKYWLVCLINIVIGAVIAIHNVLLSFPIMLIGLTFGMILIIFNSLWR